MTINPLNRANGNSFRNWLAVPLFSALLLIPCFWQSRIQSADLSSHVYNAWLASQIHRGAAPGLWISPQSSNVLFDLMLEWLLVRFGPGWAQRIAVSVCVLVFAWGAILFLFRAGGRNWWLAGPCVAMLAYGFIFCMGFFNFYLPLGLCLWYLAIFWDGNWWVRSIAAPLLILAWIAHPVPVLWAVCLASYVIAARHVEPRRRVFLLIAGLMALAALRFILTSRYPYSWSLAQFTFVTGANQIALFDWKYVPVLAGLLSVWAILLHSLIKSHGAARLASTILFQLWLLSAGAAVLLPDRLLLPQFARPLAFIAQRFSLMAGVMLCAVLAAAPMHRLAKTALVLIALVFFGFLYVDQRKLNATEDWLDAAVHALPAGARVIARLRSASLWSLCIHHQLDRACIGHCYSYANYEPSSGQFRVRAMPGNGIVLASTADIDKAAAGSYVVEPRDVPLYIVYPCGRGLEDVCSRLLEPGETSGTTK